MNQPALTQLMSLSYRIWPNGQAVVWRERKLRRPDPWQYRKRSESFCDALVRLGYHHGGEGKDALASLGLSIVRNFSKIWKAFLLLAPIEMIEVVCVGLLGRRKGLKGISAYGRKVVANAIYVLENTFGKERLSFATATIPAVENELAQDICEHWGVVVDTYTRAVRRLLKDNGVCSEVVTVTEIQGKRYEKAEFPPLHLHTVFVGKKWHLKGWVISPARHDKIWCAALRAGLRAKGDVSLSESRKLLPAEMCRASCNIQRVRTSAARYLSKYLSKALDDTFAVIERGHADYLPRQWWGASRGITRQVKAGVCQGTSCADSLFYGAAGEKDDALWRWKHSVDLVFEHNHARIAVVGWLKNDVIQQYKYLNDSGRGVGPPPVYLDLYDKLAPKALSGMKIDGHPIKRRSVSGKGCYVLDSGTGRCGGK